MSLFPPLLLRKFGIAIFFVAALLATAPPAAHALITNGENAVDILGQFTSPSSDVTSTYTKNCINNGASSLGFNTPAGGVIDSTNHRLFLADSGNNRVLVFTLNSNNTLASKTPANVLGQPDFVTCATESTSQSSLNVAVAMDFDATNNRLFVVDGNSRVMIFNLAGGITNGMNASYELGEGNFTGVSNGDTQSLMGAEFGLAYDSANNRLFVADTNNNRVMVFNVAPSYLSGGTGGPCSSGSYGNGENACYELGQPSGGTAFTTKTAATSQSALSSPRGLAYDSANTLLYVSDYSNNRVMVFNVATGTIANGENASWEIGQPSGGGTDYTTSGTATTQSGLWAPDQLAYDSAHDRLFVAEYFNSRVSVFPTSATGGPLNGNGENASYVLGAPDFTTRAYSTTQSSMHYGSGATYDSTNNLLYVSDANNNRVMIFDVTPTLPTISSPTMGGRDACAIAGGALYCWGTNTYGEDGTGNSTQYKTPVQIGTATNWTVASQGDNNFDAAACGIAGGALYCWGNNADGELGLGNTTQYTTPQQVGSDTTWTAISQSGTDACGIDSGKLYCWGLNNNGQDGTGNTSQNLTPQQVGSATNWTAIRQGTQNTCGIAGGALYCWGHNHNGESGLGNTTQHTTPQQVGSDTTWTAISQGQTDTCGIDSGKLYCWGWNEYGELGLGNTTEYTTPQQVGSATNWTAVSIKFDDDGGKADACGIAGGALYCWGQNSDGEDGLGNTTSYNTPQQVGSATNWTVVSFGDADTCGIAGGQLYCWGNNAYGELGVGNTTQSTSPQAVNGLGYIGNGMNASDELGQYTTPSGTTDLWTGNGYNNGPTALGFYEPDGVALDTVNHYLYVSDCGNNRVLVYTLNTDNSIPTSSGGHTASYVIGQTSLQGASTASTFQCPRGLAYDPVNQRLFVGAGGTSDAVYVFSTSGGFSGNVTAYSGYVGGAGGPTQSRMNGVDGVAYDPVNSRLFVSDNGENRVLVFNVAPGFSNGENASYVLGQADFTHSSINEGGTAAANSFDNPTDVAYDAANNRLFVSDAFNVRVLVFNVAPSVIANNENASYVLGSSIFTGGGGGAHQNTLYDPVHVSYDPNNSRLFVTDSEARLLVFNVAPSVIANGENASNVLGQSSFTSITSATTQSGLSGGANSQNSAFYDPGSGRVFVSDFFNNRVMIFDGNGLPGGDYFNP